MSTTVEEYARCSESFWQTVWINGKPWAAIARVLRPLGGPHRVKPVCLEEIRRAMKATGAVVSLWNEQWDTQPCDWWWVCCDDPAYDVETLPKNARRDIRAGLRRCEIRRLELEWYSRNRYAIDAAAVGRYRDYQANLDPTETRQRTLVEGAYPGRETWGAFVDGAFAAYMDCLVIDDAAFLASTKAAPAFFKALVNNALAYHVTKHYLQERKVKYVCDGQRSLVHQTQYQDFLEKMGYRRIYCPLRAEFAMPARLLVRSRIDIWGRAAILKFRPALWRKIEGLIAADRIARSCRDATCPTGQG